MEQGRRRRNKRGDGERLATEILDAATDLLIETGSADAVSIRAVAQRAGVTPPSIYLHFPDKGALLTAVVARYLGQLDDVLTEAEEGAPTPLDAARAQGLGYVRFALETPELYRLAAMTPSDDASAVDVVLTTAAFAHLEQNVRELQEVGYYPPGDPQPIALRMLTVVHGVASLLVAKPFLPWGDPIEYADRVISGACLGIALTAGMDELPDGAAALALVRELRGG
ncbi:TetR/AcrR family transcriptional regulator [Tsukamurella ocularis]|uniref:TetR/AcrR family transcriptional regulator n=1 Tax=Tsukamurella ocularis TaxID=1970234 RepID=UPI00216A585F|nr:TetR/AcrR family transcriptional regulator [Tsukamurella ocularis]MCS3781187.1 AcrR family transcriptional regulator [Tsukamurella ocularis]MCS3787011.1 AcrR family transcriptional regulator [Tsukamurella ocularis]MCS3850853.1 AcrR family transcriptional regulator [Tsukamurella ocularis]